SRLELRSRPGGRAGPVARRDAGVDDPVAAARVQLRGHPEGLERVRELGLRRPGGGPPQACRGGDGARAGARAARELPRRRLVGGDRRDAARLAVAARARRRARARLRLRPAPPLHRRVLLRRARRVDAARLARRGAAGERGVSMSDYVAGGVEEGLVPRTTEARNARDVRAIVPRRRGPGVAFWGMAMLIASEATLFGTFIGTYYYLRFTDIHWPPPGT